MLVGLLVVALTAAVLVPLGQLQHEGVSPVLITIRALHARVRAARQRAGWVTGPGPDPADTCASQGGDPTRRGRRTLPLD